MFDPSLAAARCGAALFCAIAFLIAGAVAPADALVLTGVRSADLAWSPSEGPVMGYFVLVSRNGGPEVVEAYSATPGVRITGEFGDEIRIRTVGYGLDANGRAIYSTPSPASEPITFAEGSPLQTTDVLAMVCGSCGLGRSVDLASVSTDQEFPVLPEPWVPVGIARDIVGSGPRIVWQNAETWQLAASELGPNGATPVALSPWWGMSSRRALGIADVDGDGRDDIVVRNRSNGDVETWTGQSGTLLSVAEFDVPWTWTWVGAYDVDGDGADELFWRADTAGDLRISAGSGSSFDASWQAVALASPGEPTLVADFDGDGDGDVLLRDETGALSIAYLDGGRLEREASLELPLLVRFLLGAPRTTAEIDGWDGEEIVTQNTSTGAVTAVEPAGGTPAPTRELFDVEAGWKVLGRL